MQPPTQLQESLFFAFSYGVLLDVPDLQIRSSNSYKIRNKNDFSVKTRRGRI